jgi:hypothetical protein
VLFPLSIKYLFIYFWMNYKIERKKPTDLLICIKKRKEKRGVRVHYLTYFFVHLRIKDFKFIIESMRLRVSSTKIDTKKCYKYNLFTTFNMC